MPNEVINVQQLPKETVATFVSHAAEMETSSYSLKETARNIRQEIVEKTRQTTNTLAHYSNQMQMQKECYTDAQDFANGYTWKKHKSMHSSCLNAVILMLSTFVAPFFIGPALAFINHIIWHIDIDVLWFFLPGTIIYLVFIIIGNRFLCRQHYKSEKKRYKKKAAEEKEKLDQCEAEYRNYTHTHQTILKKLDSLNDHAHELDESATKIDEALKKHYSVGIIPPDYRDMIRVLYINRAFRNDQVDTMREATLICDRDIHHSEIVDSLNEIASAITGLSSILQDISYKVSIMNAELKSIADGQDMLLSETVSARYAAEAIKKSQENLVMYEDMKRYQ